jgi:hypothetical protein
MNEHELEIIPNQNARTEPVFKTEAEYREFSDRYREDVEPELAKLPVHVNWSWPYF